jgi:D-arabinonate dehydratase
VPNGTYVETHHPDRDPIFHKMIQGRGEISSGKYRIPSAPGWGISFDPDFIAHHQLE